MERYHIKTGFNNMDIENLKEFTAGLNEINFNMIH